MLVYHFAGIIKTLQVLDVYDIPAQSGFREFLEILIVLYALRAAICLSYLLGWRWSIWAMVIAHFGVYAFVPWINLPAANPKLLFVIFVSFMALITAYERHFLTPWSAKRQEGHSTARPDR